MHRKCEQKKSICKSQKKYVGKQRNSIRRNKSDACEKCRLKYIFYKIIEQILIISFYKNTKLASQSTPALCGLGPLKYESVILPKNISSSIRFLSIQL